MRGFVVALLLLVPSVVHAEDRIFRVSLVAAISAHAADGYATMYCLGAGTCRETNIVLGRFADRPALYGATQLGIAALSLWATTHIHDTHPKLATILNFTMTAVFTSIAVHNGRVVRE